MTATAVLAEHDWHAGVRAAQRVAAFLDTPALDRVWSTATAEAHRVPVGQPGAFTPDDHFAWGYLGCLGWLLDERCS